MKIAAWAMIIAILGGAATGETWRADTDHTEVRAYWDHGGFSEQSLEFTEVVGELQFSLESVADSRAFFTIPVKSLATGVERLDSDLWGPTFFDAETYPNISFSSTSFRQTGPMEVEVTGDLTIRDVTRPVTFDVTVRNVGEHPVAQYFAAFKGNWLGVTAVARILRSEWGMGAFIPIGSDEIRIEINSELREVEPG